MGGKTKVHAAQQHQGGGGETFNSQARRGNGSKENGEKRSPKQIRKDEYAKRIGVTKPKLEVQEGVWMTECHCNGRGTCSVCVQERKREERTQEKQRLARISGCQCGNTGTCMVCIRERNFIQSFAW